MFFNIIVCTDNNNGIGKDNDIPWKLNKDMTYFTNITIGNITDLKYNIVIMGNNTYNSITSNFKPLKKELI